jgi:hypothetical protein
MAEKATTAAPEAGPATQENEPTTDPNAVTAEQEAAFGLEGAEVPEKMADPAKEEPKSDKPESKADPDKESTSSTGPGEKEESQPAPKYAGKFETETALEEGYNQAQTHIRKIEGENKEFRTTMQKKIDDLEKQLTEKATAKPEEKAEPDEDMAAIKELFVDNFGDEAGELIDKVLSKLNRKPTGDVATDEVMGEIERLKAERVQDQFYALHPEAKETLLTDAIDKILVELPNKVSDPLFQMELVLGLAKSQLLPQLIDKGVQAKLKAMSEKEKQALIAGSLVSGEVTGGAVPGLSEPSEKDVQKAYFGDDAV